MPHHFLNLPLEIRREIYAYCLASDEGIELSGEILVDNQNIQVNLLRTCRQIHDEAAPVLYSDNEFCVSDGNGYITGEDYLAKFLDNIGPRNRALLCKLALVWPGLIPDADDAIAPLNEAIKSSEGRLNNALTRVRNELMDGEADYIVRCIKRLADCPQMFRCLGIMMQGSGPHPVDLPYSSYGLSDREFFACYPAIGQELIISVTLRVQSLVLGMTADFEEAEAVAVAMGVEKLQVIWSQYDRDAIRMYGKGWPGRTKKNGGVLELVAEHGTLGNAGADGNGSLGNGAGGNDPWTQLIENIKQNGWEVDDVDDSAWKFFSYELDGFPINWSTWNNRST